MIAEKGDNKVIFNGKVLKSKFFKKKLKEKNRF